MCAYGRPEPVKVESGAWWIPWRALSRVSGPRGGSTGDNPRAQTSFPARTSSRALPLPLPLTAPFLSRARARECRFTFETYRLIWKWMFSHASAPKHRRNEKRASLAAGSRVFLGGSLRAQDDSEVIPVSLSPPFPPFPLFHYREYIINCRYYLYTHTHTHTHTHIYTFASSSREEGSILGQRSLTAPVGR